MTEPTIRRATEADPEYVARRPQLDTRWLCELLEHRLAGMRPREKTLILKFTRGAAQELLGNLRVRVTEPMEPESYPETDGWEAANDGD